MKLTLAILAATTAVSGAEVVTGATPISLGVFGVGISSVVGAALYLGGKLNDLKHVMHSLDEGSKRFQSLEERMHRIETQCAVHLSGGSRTQRVNIPGGDL